MATLVLAGAGSAIGGPVGQGIGAAIGAYLDNNVLFPPDGGEQGKLNGLKIGSSNEGDARMRCYGAQTRVPGLIIWTGGLRVVKEEVGGKGTPEQEIENYTVDIAVEFCHNHPDVGAVSSIDRIYVDTMQIWNSNVDFTATSTGISVESVTVVSNWSWFSVVTGTVYTDMLLKSTDTDADLSTLKSGYDMLIAGFTETDYNGTYRVLSSYTDGSETFAKVRITNGSSTAGEAAGNSVTVTQGTAQGLLKYDTRVLSGNPSIYLGDETHTADSVIEASVGAGLVPAYNDSVFAVFDNMKLKVFSNRIPTTFEGKVIRDSSDDLEDIVNDILLESDLESGDWDVSALAGIDASGYHYSSPTSPAEKLAPLMVFYNITIRDDNGVLTFLPITSADSVTVDDDDLEATERELAPDSPFRTKDDATDAPPAEVDVQYFDTDDELQIGTQNHRRRNAQNVSGVHPVRTNISCTAKQARNAAARMLWRLQTSVRAYEKLLPPSYIHVQESDILSTTIGSETYTMVAQELTHAATNGVSVLSTKSESHIYTQDWEAEAPPDFKDDLYSAPEAVVFIIDIAALQETDAENPGVYCVAATPDQSQAWPGASIYESVDNTTFDVVLGSYTSEATMGVCTTAANDIGAKFAQWDEGSSVVVDLFAGSLENKTADQVRQGSNIAVFGDEICGFKNATLNANGTYTLTGLMRGMFNTEFYMNEHTDGEKFVLLTSSGVEFLQMSNSDYGRTMYHKCVADGQTVANQLATQTDIRVSTVVPPDAVHLSGVRNFATNDWALSWRRRSRSLFNVFQAQEPPLYEDTESYEIDIMNGSSVARTITSTTPSATYTSAQQVTDFGSNQSTITFRVYQISARIGRGRVAEKTT